MTLRAHHSQRWKRQTESVGSRHTIKQIDSAVRSFRPEGKGDQIPSPPCTIYGFYLLDACALTGQARVASQTGMGDPSPSHVSHNYNHDVILIRCPSLISSEVVQDQELGWNRATLAVPIRTFGTIIHRTACDGSRCISALHSKYGTTSGCGAVTDTNEQCGWTSYQGTTDMCVVVVVSALG
jgi:hypothetical protein